MIRENIFINLIHFLYKKIIFQILNHKKFEIKKTNKNIIIIGAGLTINELTKKNLNYFEKHFDIATLSYGALVPKKIDFFFYEPPDPNRYNELFYNNYITNVLPELKKIMKKSSTKNIIIKNIFDKNFPLNMNSKKIYKIFNWGIRAKSLKRIFKIYKILDYFKFTKKNIIQKRGSIVGLIIWALENGYEKVILAGIDLNSYTYFFEKNKNFEKKKFLSLEKNTKPNISLNNLHPTAVIRGNLNILDIFNELNKKYKSRIYLTSKNSKLSKIFPVFKYDA